LAASQLQRRQTGGYYGIRWLSSSPSPAADGAAASPRPPEHEEEELYETLYMWGTDKDKGCLLKPEERQTESKIDVPVAVHWREAMGYDASPEVKLRKVVCGATDTAYLLSDGTCWVSGENKQGQLGVGHKDAVHQPVRVELPPDTRTTEYIKDVSLGPNSSAWIDDAGDLYTGGFGGSAFAGMGMLGHGNGDSFFSPKLVESLVEDGCYAKQVQVGESHMTVLTTEGEVLSTGAGSYGRLGNFDTVDQLYLEPVELLSIETGITQIAGGKSFTLALASKAGVVYGWGRNHKGQLGTGLGLAVDMYAMQAVPEPIQADELLGRRVTSIATGTHHAACITKGGELFWWGMSIHLEPVRVNDLLHTQVVDVVCGKDYTIAVDVEGRAYSFGKGKTGVLGQGGIKQANQAALMEAFVGDGVKVGKISAGWDHAACLVTE